MEFYEEVLLTAVVSILLAFLIGKIAADVGPDNGDTDSAGPAEAVARAAVMEQKPLHPPKLGRGVGGRREEMEELEAAAAAVAEMAAAMKLHGEVPAGSGKTLTGEIRVGQLRSELDEAGRGFGFDLVEEESREEDIDSMVCEPSEEMDRELDTEVKIEKIKGDFAVEEETPVEVENIALAVPKKVASEGVEVVLSEALEEEKAADEVVAGLKREKGVEGKGGTLLHGEDEWEGIEKSDLEKLFQMATEYVASEKGADVTWKLSHEVQMRLLGLQKVAIEGPCYEPQPMALKISARAKWNAWQRLGSMNPDAAMEQYISLLTDSVPGWTGEVSRGEVKSSDGHDPPKVGLSATRMQQSTSSYVTSGDGRVHEDASDFQTDTDNVAAGPTLLKQGLMNTFVFNLVSPARITFLISFL